MNYILLATLFIFLSCQSHAGSEKISLDFQKEPKIKILTDSDFKTKKARDFFEKGYEFYLKGDFEKAYRFYERANFEEGENYIILNSLGCVQCKLENYSKSDSLFLEIQQKFPKKAATVINFSTCLIKQKKFLQASSLLKEACKEYENQNLNNDLKLSLCAICHNLSLALLNLNECKEAGKYLDQAISLCTDELILTDLNILKRKAQICQ